MKKEIWFCLICSITPAQTLFDSTSTDSNLFFQLKEIEIISTKFETRIKDLSFPIEISDDSEIFKCSGSTPSDILKSEAGLAKSADGTWGTYITIRGLNKNNIVTLIDGNRIETANDIAGGLSLIDINEINKIEVLKSAASSLYGSGAMGGVVNIITSNSFYYDAFRLKVSALSSYGSVNDNSSGTLSLNSGNTNWFFSLTGTLRNAGNTKTPDGILKNSQFRNKNYAVSSGFKFSDKQEIKISHQNYIAEDVGIPGNMLFTPSAEVKYLKAERKLYSMEYVIKNLMTPLLKLKTKLFFQEISRDVENKPDQVSPSANGTKIANVIKITPNGNHKTSGVSLQSDWVFGKHFIIAGIEAWQRELITIRERELIIETIDTSSHAVISSVHKIIGERPIPDSKYMSIGIFAQDEFDIIENKLKVTLGGRIDQINVENEEVYNPLYEITNGSLNNSAANKKLIWNKEKANDISWSSNINFMYSLTEEIDLTFSAASSFRSPSLEERYQYIDLGSYMQLGNPDLKPELGYFFDTGLRIWKDNLNFRGNIFLNNLNNLVSESEGIFEERKAFIKTNIGSARLYGFDFSFEYYFNKDYSFTGMLSYVNGEDLEQKTNLPQIPPLNGRIAFSFFPVKYFQLGLAASFFANQNNIAPGESATPGYITYGLNLFSVPLSLGLTMVQISSGIDNITNKLYRNHLSSFRGLIKSESGRNYYLKLKVEL